MARTGWSDRAASTWRDRWLVTALLVGLGLRLYHLGAAPLWFDEVMTADWVLRSWRGKGPVEALDQSFLEDQCLGRDLAEADAVLAGEVVLPVGLAGIGAEAE